MARQRKQSGGLMAALGKQGRDALMAHRGDETVLPTGGDLPEGIDGGVAQLIECKFDQYKKGPNEGEYYFIASGIVKEPSVVGNIPVRGLRTQIMEAVCDTPNYSRETVDEHFGWILNQLRLLGANTEDVDGDSVEAVAQLLKEEQPHFRFRTWKGAATEEFPNPRVNHVWSGACDYVDEGEEEVVDETEEEEEIEADLAELGELADGGNDDATLQLTDKAEEAGLNPDTYDTWASLAGALEASTDEEEEEEEIVPEKEEIYNYRPPRARKDVECEVTAVFTGKKSCNLRNLVDTSLTYNQVPWSKLIISDE